MNRRVTAAVVLATALLLGARAPAVSSQRAARNAAFTAAQVVGSPIAHVIVIVQENRTFDDLFAASILDRGGPYPGANTAQTTIVDGRTIHLKPVPFEFPADPSHTHAALLAEWNGGKMDGFAHDRVYTILGEPTPAPGFTYAYLPARETTMYDLLAARYALADENFAPRLVPTFASHYTLVTGRSYVADDPNSAIWGCDAAPSARVPIFGRGEAEITPGVFPCFTQPTVADLLDRAHVSWKYYTGAIDDLDDPAVNIYDAFRAIRYGPDWHRNVVTPSGRILDDIAHCRLPQVAFVMPNWLDSDHAGNLSAAGPGWVGSIYQALVYSQQSHDLACRYYTNSAILLTWDDSGGWYDHVRPPAGPDGTTWGFRIPILAISAWARSNYNPKDPHATPYVSHTVRESTSILAFIERNWALGNLGQRDATDDDLRDMFDYARAQPIPPFSYLAMAQMIERTHFDLARIERNDHVVDSDR